MAQINPPELDKIVTAILKAQSKIQWNPQKAYPHLMKRIRLGHLPENATMGNYEAIIYSNSRIHEVQ